NHTIYDHMHIVAGIGEYFGNTLGSFEAREDSGQEHDRLGKDDRHDTSAVHLQRQELTRAAELPVADDLLGIVHGNLTHALDQDDQTHDNSHQYGDFDNEFQDAAGTLG